MSDKKSMEDLLALLSQSSILDPREIPNIDLYMDQVTTFFDDKLSCYKRNEDDKILTKMMVNNYTKDRLIPAPDKKKYAREHMLLLVLIYHMKKSAQINDIHALLGNISDLDGLYENFMRIQRRRYETISSEIKEEMQHIAEDCSTEVNEDSDFFRLLLALSLIIDSNTKKQMAEMLVDNYFAEPK